jgi:hypothetical protein
MWNRSPLSANWSYRADQTRRPRFLLLEIGPDIGFAEVDVKASS